MSEQTKCPDCQVESGQPHEGGCDIERCPSCGGQSISCGCIYEYLRTIYPEWNDLPEGMPKTVYEQGPTDEMCDQYESWLKENGGRTIWTGRWPGEVECEEFDLWCYWGPDYGENGWRPCTKDHPGARHDLNRLHMVTKWDPEKRMMVKR